MELCYCAVAAGSPMLVCSDLDCDDGRAMRTAEAVEGDRSPIIDGAEADADTPPPPSFVFAIVVSSPYDCEADADDDAGFQAVAAASNSATGTVGPGANAINCRSCFAGSLRR